MGIWSEYINMFDLNSSEFQGTSVFNGGNAGLVKNVEISVEKKQDDSNNPDYKIIAKDSLGTINVGFYYVTANQNKTDEENIRYAKMQVGRVLHAAKAVVGADYKFPVISSSKEAYDVLFKLIMDNIEGKKFNIYASYGTNDRPSKYLGFRYFNFIEPADTNPTTLYPKNTDLLTKPVQDDDSNQDLNPLDSLDSITSKKTIDFKI